MKKCCVIGFGPAGIIAAKHLKDAGIKYEVFEQMDDFGGTWAYTENETDSLGTPVHTSMYKSLRTNQPKEIMKYANFDYRMEESFIKSSDVYNYMKDYININKLLDNVKLGHKVTNVSYINDQWQVIVQNMRTKDELIFHCDAVMVCNGHHYLPRFPDIEGKDEFEGTQMHSKSYRVPEIFKDKTLLVIGFAYSGQDIADDASKVAKKVFLSHHAPNYRAEYFRNNVISKPDVKKLHRDSVTFIDGSTEKIDAILYCTGYLYTYPFLDESCGILVDDNYVKPLHKQLINIAHPTMAFVGLPFVTFIFPLLEVQVRAFIKILQDQVKLPDEKEMWEELRKFEQRKIENKVRKRDYHRLESVRHYVRQLNTLGGLNDLPEVLYKIYDYNLKKRQDSLVKYRYYIYKTINDYEFTVQAIEDKDV